MDFSPEGLRNQAVALFASARTLRRGLPRKSTPELDNHGQACGRKFILALNRSPVFRKWICDAFDHKELGIGIYIMVTAAQCENEETAAQFVKADRLPSQMAFVTADIMAQLPRNPDTVPKMPPTHHLQHVPRVWVRIEVLLTRAEDCAVFEFTVLDPRAELDANPQDLETLRRRAHRETGIPKEQLDGLVDQLISCSTEQLEIMCSPYSRLDMANAYTNQLRGCLGCGKYGITLLKCSGCRAVYYCGRECQVAHWPTHKPDCASSSSQQPRDK